MTENKATFWYHPESESYWMDDGKQTLNSLGNDTESIEVTEYQYIQSIIDRIDNDPEHTLPEGITAVLKGAYRFMAGGLHGSIHYDKHKRFPDGHQIGVSRITSVEPGGIYKTKNSTYLVQMIEPEPVKPEVSNV